MPKGIYKRTKKAKRASATSRAATKKKRGRPPGSKTKTKRGRPPGSKTKAKAASPKRVRKAAGRAGSPKVFADFGALLTAIVEFGKLLDQRSKILVNALNEIGDAIREAGGIEVEDKAAAPQAAPAPAEEPAGAVNESAPVS